MSALTAVLVAAVLSQGYYTPEEAQALFSQANEAYAREDYPAAREGYEKLLSRGLGGPDVLYNLGTTYLAQGDVGRAVLSLERAKRQGGQAPDLEANLAMARAKQVDKVVGPAAEEPFLTRVVEATDGRMAGWGFLGAWVLGFGMLLLFRFLKPGRRAWAGVLAALGLIAALPTGALVAAHVYVQQNEHDAVVLAPSLSVRELPRDDAKARFDVHAGLKVRLMEDTDRFVRIRLPNGLDGWVARDGVSEI